MIVAFSFSSFFSFSLFSPPACFGYNGRQMVFSLAKERDAYSIHFFFLKAHEAFYWDFVGSSLGAGKRAWIKHIPNRIGRMR
jgi:hypothetical protein